MTRRSGYRVPGIGGLGIDRAKAHQTRNVAWTCRRISQTGRKVEMAKGGVQTIAPHQEPPRGGRARRIRVFRRTIDGLRRFDEFVGSSADCPWLHRLCRPEFWRRAVLP